MTSTKIGSTLFSAIRGLILWPEIGLATLSLIPIFVTAWLCKNVLFLKVGLITMSLFIAASRLKYNFATITLHYCLILLGFSLLYFSLHYMAPLFVLLCALMALWCIWLTRFGEKLRTFGNFTFIPSVYLACEMYYVLPQQDWLVIYWQFMAITPLAWLTMAVLYYFSHKVLDPNCYGQCKFNLLAFPDKGTPLKDWLASGIAIFLSVLFSASLAIVLHIDSPEWLIWSTASVITTELVLSRVKFAHRFLGAIIGISMGLCLSRFLPQTELIYSLAVLGVMLTLTSFKNYLISFTSRCFFITLAAYAISTSEHIALVRVQNVFLGGIIGLVFLYFTHYFSNKRMQH